MEKGSNGTNAAESWVLQASNEEIEWLQQQLQGDSVGDASWTDPSGGVLTKLFDAVEEGDDETTATLLKELGEHSIDSIGPEGDTLLHLACLYAHRKCAKLLVEHGACLTATDEDESTVLHDAAAGGDMEIVKLLVDKAPALVHAVDSDGDTPLHNAARGGNTDIVAFLLLEGANPHLKNKEGHVPRATCEDVKAVCDMLLIAEKGFQQEK